jgi:hypothetical protein
VSGFSCQLHKRRQKLLRQDQRQDRGEYLADRMTALTVDLPDTQSGDLHATIGLVRLNQRRSAHWDHRHLRWKEPDDDHRSSDSFSLWLR